MARNPASATTPATAAASCLPAPLEVLLAEAAEAVPDAVPDTVPDTVPDDVPDAPVAVGMIWPPEVFKLSLEALVALPTLCVACATLHAPVPVTDGVK